MAKDTNNGANLGFESDLWRAADALRSNMDAAEYKHVVLGLIFLKYISDAFEEQHVKLEAERSQGADPEDPDEYRAVNIFWVPREARWSHLKANAKQPAIGKIIDDAMLAIERDNPSLKGVLPKDYAHPRLDKQRLGQLIDLVGNIGLGDKANRSKDILGRVYEYFLSRFAGAEGKKGGQFYTPRCVVRLLVEMLSPYKGRVYDPCCGSGGMFVQSEKFVEAHGGKIGDISIYGQESNHTTWRLAKMNLAIRGIDGNLGKEHADSFHRDLHPDLKADYVIATAPSTIRLGRRAPRTTSGGNTAFRPPGTPTSHGCSTSFTTWPRPVWRASSWPTARCPPTSPARVISAKTSSKPIWWTAWWLCPDSSFIRRRFRYACGSLHGIKKIPLAPMRERAGVRGGTDAAKHSSSTPARWAP